MARSLISVPPTSRVGRYPKHVWNLQSVPFTLQPFCIAPVLPGETLKNAYMETRVITDPILNPITPWKKEYFLFYVRISDLLQDAIRDMFIDPTNGDIGATFGIAANDQAYYTAKGGINYLQRCIERIWTHHFSDQDDVFANNLVAGVGGPVNGLPIVQIRDRFWLDSITDDDRMPEGAAISTATDAGDLERLMEAFENLRALGLQNMTYEDWLRSYGISIPGKDENKPELLAKFGDVQYPSNTVNPATGAPTSAISWVFKNSARDPKSFKEPGFIVGITVTRPKVLYAGLAGSMAAHLTRAWDWLPNYMNEGAADPYVASSLKRFTSDAGPLGDRTTATDEYWVDTRDLFLHGDQFQNRFAFAPAPAANGNGNMVALPDGDNHERKYPRVADIKSFFVEPNAAFSVREDGMVSLSILGKQVDYTPGNVAEQ